jgi:hypothetical protein
MLPLPRNQLKRKVMEKNMQTGAGLIELNDAALDAVAGGISLSFGSFGGAQNRSFSGGRMGNPGVNTRGGDPNARGGDPAARNQGLDPAAVTRFLLIS